MTGKRAYAVDWSDPPYPQIRFASQVWGCEPDEALTFAQAKQEIIDHFVELRRAALESLRRWRAYSREDWLKERFPE